MKSLSLSAPAFPRRAAVAAAVAALALAGCANYFGVQSDKQIVVAGAVRVHAEPARARAASGRRSSGPTSSAIRQLPKLIDEALEGSPSIAQAQARLAKASSYIESLALGALSRRSTAAIRGPANCFSGNALYPPPYGGTWYSENNVLASASWDLDLWGKNRSAARRRRCRRKRRPEADMQQARVTLAASVASTYNQLAQLYALRDIAAARDRQPPEHRTDHEWARRRGPRHQRRASDRDAAISRRASRT